MTSLKVHENPKQSGLPGAKDVRKRFRVPGEKVCKICEDKALAHHFNVLSCESCKAFFRRNALKKSVSTIACTLLQFISIIRIIHYYQ